MRSSRQFLPASVRRGRDAELFRPFFRGANAARAEGHGLGLAIVERIARAHGGQASAANAAGGGLCVTLSLPLVAATAGGNPPRA